MIQTQTNLNFPGRSDKTKGKPSRPFAYIVWLRCHCDGLILHNYVTVRAWWLSCFGSAIYTAAEGEVRCFPANCVSVDHIRGDEYSEVTYSTQGAMASDKNKHALGLSACVSGELWNITIHNRWTKHVTYPTNSMFTMNISFQTLDIACAQGDSIFLIMSHTLRLYFSWQLLPRGPCQLSFNTSSAMGSMCHSRNHESSLCCLLICLCS